MPMHAVAPVLSRANHSAEREAARREPGLLLLVDHGPGRKPGRRNRLLAPALKPFGLRVPEWRVLASLHSRHKASFKELAELASFDQTTLSRTIDRMVVNGLVTRLSDVDDMRVTRLALTAKGETLFHDLWPTVAELNAASCARLPEGGEAMLRWLLSQMRQSLDEMIAARRPQRSLRRAAAAVDAA